MPIGPNGLKVASSVRNHYFVSVPAGTALEELQDPKFWVHCARLLRQGDKVEILAADASWYAEARVMETGRHESFGARVAFTLLPVGLKNDNALPALNDYEARPIGASWHVFKVGKPDPVKTDLPDQNSAVKWINSQRKALAA